MKRVLAMAALLCIAAAAVTAQEDTDLQAGEDAGPDAPAGQQDQGGFFSHGYLRFGLGNSNGEDFFTFKLDGAQSKYRLGNESDLYGEFGAGYSTGLGNGMEFTGEFMINLSGDSNAINNGAEFAGDSGVVKAYSSYGNTL